MIEIGGATTDTERAAETAIASVAAWEGASITYRQVTTPVMSPMHKSVDADGFAVDVERAPYFLKVIHPERRTDIDILASFEAAAAAAAMGIAPRAVHCLEQAGAIVFDRLDANWRPAMVDDLQRSNVMAAAVEAKKRIHNGPALRRSWSAFEGIRGLSLSAPAGAIIASDLAWMTDAIGKIEQALEAAGTDTRPCHADGIASNVMIGPGDGVRLVDFDAACNTDPLYDLGIFLNEAYVFDEEMAPALETYEGSVRATTLNRCRLYAIADDFYWALWSNQMSTTSSRRNIEFLKYAQWRLLRCRMALRDPHFDDKLRAI